MHKHLGHALAQSSLAAVLRALKTSAQVPGTQHLLRSCAMVLRLFVHTDETQSLFLAFDLYIILSNKVSYKKAAGQADYSAQKVTASHRPTCPDPLSQLIGSGRILFFK